MISMNIEERKNLLHRIISVILLMIPLALMVICLIHVFCVLPEGYVISIIGMILAIGFLGMEVFVMLRGGKKESSLYKIAFNENQKVNTFPIIMVSIGTALGLGLTLLSSIVFFQQDEPNKSAMLVVLAIGAYLLINCIIYYLYVIMFKKRPLDLRKFIK